jgi:hypothetical protein
MAENETGAVPDENEGSGADQRQDPLVERLRPDPASPPVRTLTFSGFAGRSDRRGYRRLYLSRTLDHYIEVRAEDVVEEERIAATDPPLVGHESTRFYVRRDATIDQVRSRAAEAVDEFDLDFRPGDATAAAFRLPNDTWGGGCTWGTDCGGGETNFGLSCPGSCGDTCQITICRGATCIDVCETRRNTWCDQATCVTCRTCRTECNQATCQTCNQGTCQTCGTCQTQCGQGTCQTCNQATCLTCDGATCQTCVTDCRGRTCLTCDTCNPHVFTCGARC